MERWFRKAGGEMFGTRGGEMFRTGDGEMFRTEGREMVQNWGWRDGSELKMERWFRVFFIIVRNWNQPRCLQPITHKNVAHA